MVRFLMQDTFYNQYIVKQGLMEPVITAFLQTGDQYNMLNSSILELFDFIRKENMKTLVHLVVQSPQWPALLAVDYVDTFKALQIKHDQNEDGGGLSGPASGLLAGDPANQEHMGRQEELQRATAAAEARRLRGKPPELFYEYIFSISKSSSKFCLKCQVCVIMNLRMCRLFLNNCRRKGR